MNIFITLMKKDLGISRSKRMNRSLWVRFYRILACILGFVLYTVLLLREKITPEFVNVIPAVLLYASFPISLTIIKREWRDNTVGWWLQLPYSRKMLLGAKFLAAFITFLRAEVIALLVSAVIWTEGIILKPEIWQVSNLGGTLLNLGRIYLETIPISFLIIIYGMLIIILMRTRLRPAAPVFWVIFGVIFSLITSKLLSLASIGIDGGSNVFVLPGLSAAASTGLGYLGVLIFVFIIYLFAAFLLEKYAEI